MFYVVWQSTAVVDMKKKFGQGEIKNLKIKREMRFTKWKSVPCHH